MALFRRRAPRRIIGRYRPPAPPPEPSLDHLVDEARLVAHAAARMAVKNRLIVDAAGHRRDFDVSGLRAFARETLEQLAQQQRAAADYVSRGSEPSRRAPVLRGLADALEADAADRAVLESVVEEARDAAWAELGSSLVGRLRRGLGGHRRDAAYERDRAERVAAFLALDLADLAYDQGFDLQREASGLGDAGLGDAGWGDAGRDGAAPGDPASRR